jgi:apolipoprotein N-acyltransferase
MNLMGGIISAWVFPRGQEPQRPLRYNPERDEFFEVYNAATLLSARLDTAHVYRKARLVPFSERPPFMETLEALKEYNLDLGGGFGAFGLPDSVTLLRTAQGVPVGPVICYESIFPDHVATLTRQGAQVLCILTNDGWWKQSSGYLQHAAFARLRAIETRRWVARSANTGRSVFISPWGTVQASLEWNQQGTLDARLPLLTAQTLYVQWGDWVGWGCVLLMCVLVIAGVVLSFAPNSRNQF